MALNFLNNGYFAGKVGIGIETPSGNLHVVGDTGSSGQIYLSDRDNGTGTGNALLINKSGASAFIYNRDGGQLSFGTNNVSNNLVIANTGNIGIGTASPTQKLHVDGNVLINGAAPYISIKTTQTGTPDWKIYNSYNTVGDFAIIGGSSVSNKFNIQPSGNIGIGTSTPSQKLHVVGNARVTGAYYDSNNTPGTLDQVLTSTVTGVAWVDPGTITAEASKLVVIECKNTSGATIAKGTPVYQTGTVGATDVIEIAPADALISSGKQPAIGLLQTTLNNNGSGKVVITGELLNFTTDPIDGVTPTTGDKVFLKSGGGLTLTKPTGAGNGIQNLGLIGKVSGGNAGSITVSSIMRTNDVPNLPTGKIWVGDSNTIVSDIIFLDEPNGRVGIGTTSPSVQLDIEDSSNVIVDMNTTTANANTTIRLQESGSVKATIGYDGTNDGLILTTGGFTAGNGIFIDDSQNVGIGTSSPSGDLHVVGKTGTAGRIYISDIDDGASATDSVLAMKSATHGYYYNRDSGNLYLGTNDNPNMMIINSSGNVGIGTTSPSSKLHIKQSVDTIDGGLTWESVDGTQEWSIDANNAGNFRIYKGTTAIARFDSSGNFGIGTTSPITKLNVAGNIAVTAAKAYRMYNAANTGWGQMSFIEADNRIEFNKGIQNSGVDWRLTENSANSFVCANQGNFGIGTTSPTQKLHVAGNLRVTGAYYDSNNAPGTLGQILSSTATGTDWIDGSAIPGLADTLAEVLVNGNTTGGTSIDVSANDDINLSDSSEARFGSNQDLIIKHTGVTGSVTNFVGNLNIVNNADDSDIRFFTDDGAGGVTTYFQLDGSHMQSIAWKDIHFVDNVKAKFGDYANPDLEIYHDGSNSYIKDAGTGNLWIQGSAQVNIGGANGQIGIQYVEGANVTLRHNNVAKLTTTSTGVTVTGNVSCVSLIATSAIVDNVTAKTASGNITFKNNTGNTIAQFADNKSATFQDQVFAVVATSSGDASSTLTTKGYVDSLITGATIYRGTWDPDVSLNSGYGNPNLNTVTQTSGYYYICSADGAATPNGTGTEPDSWNTGDWVIWNDDIGASGEWQKIDNSSVLSGVGTGQTVALWQGASSVTDSETLGNAPITVSGNNATFTGDLTVSGGDITLEGTGRIQGVDTVSASTDAANKAYVDAHPDGTVKGTGTATRVAFWSASDTISSSDDLYWDNTGKNLGIGDNTPTARLFVSDTTSSNTSTVQINHTRDDADKATRAIGINMDLSGADTTTADRTNYGLYLDIDSSANGDASNEHRIYGVGSTINFTGYSDIVRGGYFLAESNYTGAKTAQLAGVYGYAIHDAGSTNGGVSNMYGVYGISSIQDLGDVDNAFGGYFVVTISTNRGAADIGVTKAVEGEISIDKDVAINYGDMIGISSIIDNNEGAVPNFGNQYLFKGDYQGDKGSNAYGIYVEGDKHFFSGNVGIGVTGPTSQLQIGPGTSNASRSLIASFGGSANGILSGLSLVNTTGNDVIGYGVGIDFHLASTYSPTGRIATIAEDTSVKAGLAFYTYESGGIEERMRIANDGNVGIGTTSPSAPLHVDAAGMGDVYSGLIQNSTTDTDHYNAVRFMQGASGSATGYIGTGGSTTANLAWRNNFVVGTQTAHSFVLATNDTERVRIDSSGKVGIGTTSPSQKLDVNGAIAINGTKMFSTIGSVSYIWNNTNSLYVVDNTGNDVQLAIKDNGSVGIGTTNPQSALQVVGGIQMADDTVTASAAKVGTMRYRTATNEPVPVTGIDLVTNGDFATDTDWTKQNAGSTISGGKLNQASVPSGQNVYQTPPLTVGSIYSATFTISNYTAGGIRILIGSTGATATKSSNGTFTVTATAAGNTTLYIQSIGTTTLSIDDISVIEVTEENASYADMCMQTGASTYEWVNIVRNTY